MSSDQWKNYFNNAFNEAIATSICLLVGSLVVSFCINNPGYTIPLMIILCLNLAESFNISNEIPAITGIKNILANNATTQSPLINENIKIEITKTIKINAVPHLGCNLEYFLQFLTVNLCLFS